VAVGRMCSSSTTDLEIRSNWFCLNNVLNVPTSPIAPIAPYLFNDNQGAVTCSRGDMNHVFALGYHFRF